jgi:ankyrin repeat protein
MMRAKKANQQKENLVREPQPFIAARVGDIDQMRRYLSENPGLITKVRHPSGWSLLHRAAEEGQTDVCQILIEHGADVNARTIWGWFTPLHLSLANGWKETAVFLHHCGADHTKLSKCGRDPMEYAKHRGFKDLASEFKFILIYENELVKTQNKNDTQEGNLIGGGHFSP